MVVIGRLSPKPILLGQIVCALLLALLVEAQARGDSIAEIAASIAFGNPLAMVAMGAAAWGLTHFVRLWRLRDAWITHDGARLYRGRDQSWPLSSIRDVVIERGATGLAALRLVVDDDSETTRPLVLLPLLDGSPEAVRGGVLCAAAGVKAVPSGVTVN